MRATVSPAFPAVNGLIALIGLAGHFSALAATVAIERATAAKDADNVRIDIMFCSRNSAMPRSRGAAALARRAEVLDFQEGISQRGADGRIGFARTTRNKLALDHIALSPVS